MIVDFNSYVVLKIISMIQYDWRQSLISTIKKDDINTYGKMMAGNGDLYDSSLWDVYYDIPTEQIEKIISNFMQRKMIGYKTIRIGGNLYSMLYVTDKGKKILYRLDKKYYPAICKYTFNSKKDWDIIKESGTVVYNLREAMI